MGTPLQSSKEYEMLKSLEYQYQNVANHSDFIHNYLNNKIEQGQAFNDRPENTFSLDDYIKLTRRTDVVTDDLRQEVIQELIQKTPSKNLPNDRGDRKSVV